MLPAAAGTAVPPQPRRNSMQGFDESSCVRGRIEFSFAELTQLIAVEPFSRLSRTRSTRNTTVSKRPEEG